MTLRVLSIASEAFPLVKTGGLADVAGALPDAVAPAGVEMTVMLPGYPVVMKGMKRAKVLHHYADLLGHEARLLRGKIGEHPLIVLDAPNLFHRDGGAYGDQNGYDWPDNWLRFAAFARAGADLAAGAVGGGKQFDLLHAHDWQAAMAPAYLRFLHGGKGAVPKSVMTIHNIAFQGQFARTIFPKLGLPLAAWAMDGVEYYGDVGFLKAGLEAADAITTVSPTYAREIRTPAFGMGLEGLIVAKGDRVTGIVNGIDPAIWNPAHDPALAKNFTVRMLARRASNKRAVEQTFGLEQGDGPLFIVISRLTWQKGMDVLAATLDHLVGLGGRLALLGSGDAALENAFHQAAARHPGRVSVRIGYDEPLSHLMQGGGDAILVPSRFEPCGLTQLYGLAYGCVPVVARTGGLADTVIDANVAALAAGAATGIQFDGLTVDSLSLAISRSIRLYHQPAIWGAIQQCGMKGDFSWKHSGRDYAALYARLCSPT